jgi:hypothetical protein
MKIQIGRHTKNPSRLEDARVFRTAARSLQNSKNIHFCVDFRTAPRGPGKPRVFKTPGISGLQAAVVRLIGRTFWPTQGQDRSTRYQEPPRLEDTGVFGSAARSLQNSKNIHFCVDFRTAPRGPGKPRVFKTPGIFRTAGGGCEVNWSNILAHPGSRPQHAVPRTPPS